MNLNEVLLSQSLAQHLEGIMCGHSIAVYTHSITIDFDFGQLLAEFPIKGNTLFDFENACPHR